MMHRTYKIGSALVNVFDSRLGAYRFFGKTPGDITVLLRGRSLHMRRNGYELMVNLRRELKADDPGAHLASAASSISDEVETLIAREKYGTGKDYAGQRAAV